MIIVMKKMKKYKKGIIIKIDIDLNIYYVFKS